MRIYKTFKEAHSEITRDLAEMGIMVHTRTYQDKDIEFNDRFESLELQNYIYTVLNPKLKHLEPSQPYCDLEWADRLKGIQGVGVNPGLAWQSRKEVWAEFLGDDGKFAYTYSQRFSLKDQVNKVIEALINDPASRQLYVSMWEISDVEQLGGRSRVPCSLGYLFQLRKDKLNCTYTMRSCDFVTHFQNDVFLAVKLQDYIAAITGYEVGTFTHLIGSLHMFKKDAQGVF